MTSWRPFQAAVESVAPGVRVVRTAGALDRAAAERLLRIADAQILLHLTKHVALRHLIVDLASVTRFDTDGLETLRAGWDERGDRGVRLHVAGCGGRVHLLPLGVGALMHDLSTFPSVEVAVAHLCPAEVPAGIGVPVPRPPSDPAVRPPPPPGGPAPLTPGGAPAASRPRRR